MADIFTRRLGAADVNGSATTILFTAPPVGQVVVRDIILWVNTGVSARTVVRIHSGLSFFNVLLDVSAEEKIVHLDLRQALVAGDVLELVSTATTTRVLVTGYLFAS